MVLRSHLPVFMAATLIILTLGFVIILLGGAMEQAHPSTESTLSPDELSPAHRVPDLQPDNPALHYPVINEILPLNPVGESQWVELYYPNYPAFLPAVQRDEDVRTQEVTDPAHDTALIPPDISLSGWRLVDKNGEAYTIPVDLQPIPPGTYLVIYYDGLGPAQDDHDFSDGVAILHTPPGLVNGFEAVDQVALFSSAAYTTTSLVDFVNGFVEVYSDPLGLKGTWESIVDFKDIAATRRTKIIAENAQWFEDHSPIDPRFKKQKVKGVSAKVITVATASSRLRLKVCRTLLQRNATMTFQL